VTVPCTFDCFAVGGYESRVEEINFASVTVLGAETGAGAAGAGASEDGGGNGGLDVRPADVNKLEGVDPPPGIVDETSVKGAVPSAGVARLRVGALGEPIFKF
jgi:hypothetical protein